MYNSDDLDEQSWENFQPDDRQPVPTERMLEKIERRVGRAPGASSRGASGRGAFSRATSARMRPMAWTAAASVIVLAGLAGLYRWRTTNKEQSAVATAHHSDTRRAPARQVITNSTATTQLFLLPDGSKVKMAAGSSLSFDSLFPGNRRDIALTGEAVFTVAKDRSKPFTVHSKDLAVTALGTVFGVDDTHNGLTTVLLYSGKVVVKKEDAAGRSFADVYLSPGQQLSFNPADLSVRIRTVGQPKSAAPENAPAAPPQQLMTFTREPLADIFRELQTAYHLTIVYDRNSVKNMDFTGTFNSGKETLESFLSTLCSLNDLTLRKTKGNGFSIQAK